MLFGWFLPIPTRAQEENPNPPETVVKLLFIHHSTGENWLADDYGGLGLALGQDNYFVSDTNYGWGPDAIGDRTDILNWLEWFRGPESNRYLTAVYNESGQNASYTRTLQDPGGENQIVMFKSCFPNSILEGNPNDLPAPGDSLTVSNAKYIYNELLKYFITRPDKLFVVITAPPVQDSTFAENARAFNNWLMQNWLSENNYPYDNVAVFDFYNVLTHSDNHHRFWDGRVEYLNSQGRNTLFYPSEDDHPNPAGSQKATEEFVPLLNVFYHRWKSGAPTQPPAQVTSGAPPIGETQPVVSQPIPIATDLIDDFEAGSPPGSSGWQPFWDQATQTVITCVPEGGIAHVGNTALHIGFNISANSWATCTLLYNEIRNWQSTEGISFYVHASQPALVFDVDVYGGAPGSLTTYLYQVETTQDMVTDWVRIELPWGMILRADWEESAGTPYDPSRVTGIAFGFNTYPDTHNKGEIWVDEIRLFGVSAPEIETVAPGTEIPVGGATPASTPGSDQGSRRRGLCPGSLALGILVAICAVWVKNHE